LNSIAQPPLISKSGVLLVLEGIPIAISFFEMIFTICGSL
jgi:hypothetical protein